MRSTPRAVAAILVTAVIGIGLAVGIGGWPGSDAACLVTGSCDCEAVGSGLVRQPTTAWTSLSFLPLGIWLTGDRRLPSPAARLLLASTVIGVGIASFLGHAAVTEWGRLLDSLAIKALLLAFIVYSLSRRHSWDTGGLVWAWAGAAGAGLLTEMAWPATARPLLVLLMGVAAALAADAAGTVSRRWLIGGLGAIGLGGATWWLGRSGAGLCDPTAVFQLHGLWHMLAAVGIAAVYQVYRIEMT